MDRWKLQPVNTVFPVPSPFPFPYPFFTCTLCPSFPPHQTYNLGFLVYLLFHLLCNLSLPNPTFLLCICALPHAFCFSLRERYKWGESGAGRGQSSYFRHLTESRLITTKFRSLYFLYLLWAGNNSVPLRWIPVVNQCWLLSLQMWGTEQEV